MAAVEFGLIGTAFMLVMCFWIELGLTLFMQTSLDNAVRNEARLIRIGDITSAGAATFASKLCNDLQFIMNCANIQYNVVSGSSFSALPSTITTNSSGQLTSTQFNPGSSGDDVLVQVAYTRPIYIPIIAPYLGTGGNRMVYSSVAFQNEPF